MHLDARPRTYRAVDGSVREYRQVLLRRSYRNDAGKPAKETLANLSMLPDSAVNALRLALAGKTLVDVDTWFQIERSLAHGHLAARKDTTKTTADNLPVYDFPGLLAHLGQLTRNTINFNGQRFAKLATPTPVQQRAFELLNAHVPLALA